MTMVTYHLLTPDFRPLEQMSDYILAGDGVYGVMECFGCRVPLPLLPAEVRGLPPLFPAFAVSSEGARPEADLAGETLAFASYHFVTEEAGVPPVDPGRLYQYVVAREGVFLLAGVPGLELLLPISGAAALPGLAHVSPRVRLTHPPVGSEIVLQILVSARLAKSSDGQSIEQLYYLQWEEGDWRLTIPEQDASPASVRARAVTPEYLAALIEGHSHHSYRANFSHRDDAAEVRDGGFRVYFVLGNIFQQPELRVRICVHGYSWEVPARCFFAMPEGIVDCVAQEGEICDAWSH